MQSLIDSFHLISCSDSPSLPSSSSSPISLSPYDSEDEVVWSLSSSSASAAEHSSQHNYPSDGDEDFVLLDKPRIRKAIRRWSDQAIDSDQGEARDSAAPATKPSDDATVAGNATSRFTPVDRAASVTPIPTSKRRPPATRVVQPSLAAPPALASVLAATQEAKNQRKLEGAVCRKREKGFKKETKDTRAAVAKVTTSEDKVQATKERKRVARRRRRERQAEASTTVTKATPTEAKVITTTTSPEIYEEASRFISWFLADPVAKQNSVCRLTLLQSLIVELGFMSSALPTTLRAARNFVKTHVFLNIKEYIANRERGQAALQCLLFPSRNALIKDIKRKGKPTSLKWVKQQGLEVLLVSCYNH